MLLVSNLTNKQLATLLLKDMFDMKVLKYVIYCKWGSFFLKITLILQLNVWFLGNMFETEHTQTYLELVRTHYDVSFTEHLRISWDSVDYNQTIKHWSVDQGNKWYNQ